MHFALIPAAGHSTRMGRPKLSMSLGDRTVIAAVIDTLCQAGIDKILVVGGPHVAELAPLAETAGASVLRLPYETPDMRRTVEEGLNWVERTWRPNDRDAFLLVPADHPVMDVSVIETLFRESRSASEVAQRVAANQECRDILIPTFDGKRGHPTLIGWRHVAGIRALPADLGLNSYLRQQPAATREVAVDSESILFDMDTPEDYENMKRFFS